MTRVLSLWENFEVALMGNHDLVCAGLALAEKDESLSYCYDVVQRGELSKEERAWLAARPYLHGLISYCYHALYRDVKPEEFDYALDSEAARMSFDARKERFLFVGHVHEAKIWEREPGGQIKEICIPPTKEPFHVFDFTPKDGCRYIVNVGLIGRPRDGYAGYVLWDSDTNHLSFHRQLMSQRLPI